MAINTLYDYYTSQKQQLPSLQERAKIFETQGLGSASQYMGTVQQNTALLGKLQTPSTISSAPITPTNIITADSLSNNNITTIPSAIPPPVDTNSIISGVTSNLPVTPVSPVQTQAEKDLTTAKTEQTGLLERIKGLYGDITGKVAYQEQQYQQTGITQKQQDVQDLTNQLNTIKAESEAAKLSLIGQGRGITTPLISGQQAQIDRNTAIKTLTTSSQLQALQGNLTLALSQVQRAVDLKYKPLEDELKNKTDQLDLLGKYVLTPAEQVRKDELTAKATKDATALADKKAKETEFNKGIIDAQQGGLSLLEANNARDLFNAGRIDEANAILAPYSKATQDRLKYQPGIVGEYQFYAEQEQAAGRQPMGFNQYKTVDENRKAIIAKAGIGGMSTAEANIALKISDDYEKASGDYSKVVSAYNRVIASAQDPSAAGDLSLVFNYMKVLDPGSTVREGEFATAQNSGGISDIIRAKYNNIISGERLSEGIRNDFVDRTKKLYESATKQQEQVNNDFKDRSTKFGIDSNLIIRNMKTFDSGTPITPTAHLDNILKGDISNINTPETPKVEEKSQGFFDKFLGAFGLTTKK